MPRADPTIAALDDLRVARRKKRIADIHWVDALYQVYLAAIIAIAVLMVLAGLTAGDAIDAKGILDVIDRGPAVLGLLPAAAILVGLRSGSRGGPLALEQPDVRHVLMSAVPRSAALRSPVLRQVRFFAFIGIVVGGVAGLFARHRLDANPVALVACGAAFGLASVMLGIGCALVAAGHRIPRWAATLVGLVGLAWAIGDVTNSLPTAPTSLLGSLALWPLKFNAWAIAPVVVALVITLIGIFGIAGLSIEHAERRTRLVGQLRFAVTLQDLRTVLVLRRQLAQELPREKPWFGGGPRRRRPRFLVWSRGWRSVLRFPASRLVRLVLVAIVAGFSARAVWDGSLPLIALAGLALWIGGLDAIEPLAQETDHPSRGEGFPCAIGEVMVRHLPVPVFVMMIVSTLTAAVFVAAGPSVETLRIGAIAIIPMAVAAVAGGVVSALMGAPSVNDEVAAMMPPEFAGIKNGLRTAWPPGLAVIGVLPILFARVALDNGKSTWEPALAVAIAVIGLTGLVAAWTRFREEIHQWWRDAMAEAKDQQGARTKSRPAPRPSTDHQEEDDRD